MAEHTPGPCGCEWRGRWGYALGSIRYCSLHAAAPDLLGALEFIVTIADLGDLQNSHEVILLKARAAIAKATGTETTNG